jgi:hypothetical protein
MVGILPQCTALFSSLLHHACTCVRMHTHTCTHICLTIAAWLCPQCPLHCHQHHSTLQGFANIPCKVPNC